MTTTRRGHRGEHTGKLLTQEQVDALDEGTKIRVTWSGGNGPAEYIVVVDGNGNRYACVPQFQYHETMRYYTGTLDFVGEEQFHTWVSLR